MQFYDTVTSDIEYITQCLQKRQIPYNDATN